uniref:NADH-ubiquinone oxidoreductase chain 4 n=1 Tax=Taeniacara candidi TaxID=97002 RepID=A0A1L2BHM5_9CICH|nr:NADH dehydrogenase subunit 4 [Taeniacara candidi]
MLMILAPTIMLIPTAWATPAKRLWSTMFTHSMIIAIISLIYLKPAAVTGWSFPSPNMAVDQLSSPLLILTCWLLPLMILASQQHTSSEPINRQRMYLSLLTVLQALLVSAFSTTELIMFYVMFEATLIPTLIIITRWGNQKQRLHAGIYFLFYTLMGSLPFLVALLYIQIKCGNLSFISLTLTPLTIPSSLDGTIFWVCCLLALLVKMPLYGLHLWLPKAHVEAPIAGSMILAAVLLKLGGYGMMRILAMLYPLPQEISYPLIVLAIWGAIMTSLICLRQTDLKSLIAYSSVSHMGLVTAGILTNTSWGFTGALLLMIAHGLTSSTLFCLANTNYERTHSRVLIMARGLKTIMPLMATWWFISSIANLALPPLPNLMAELTIIITLFDWSKWTLVFTGLITLITVAYSLYLYIMTQQGHTPSHIIGLDPSHTREHLLMTLHLTPLLLLITKPELIWDWAY